ncbi:hypothetical protein ScPMuIL_016829 [Solemya velum]
MFDKKVVCKENMSMMGRALWKTTLDLTLLATDALVKNRKNCWIQLAGHPGSFAPAGPNTIWKRRLTKDHNERKAYEGLMDDEARSVVPLFHREVEYNGEHFIEMEDLLQRFKDPNIMDIKMGTFLESEVQKPALRTDLYEKMIALDPNAPTEEEKKQKSITKLRYMQFREKESSTQEFGFRVEAVRMSGEQPNTSLKKVKTKEQITCVLSKFLKENKNVGLSLLKQLVELRKSFETSSFFMTHEVIGSSLLVIYDKFGNTDGFLLGLDNIIKICNEICDDCKQQELSSQNSNCR